MALETDILERIRGGGLALPPAVITVVETESPTAGGGIADFLVEAQWGSERCRFVAGAKKVATPRTVQQAMLRARNMSSPPETYPMIIVPYWFPLLQMGTPS